MADVNTTQIRAMADEVRNNATAILAKADLMADSVTRCKTSGGLDSPAGDNLVASGGKLQEEVARVRTWMAQFGDTADVTAANHDNNESSAQGLTQY